MKFSLYQIRRSYQNSIGCTVLFGKCFHAWFIRFGGCFLCNQNECIQTWGDAVYLCNQTLFAPLLNVSIVNFILRVGIEPSSKFIIQACPRIRVFSQVKRQSCAVAAVWLNHFEMNKERRNCTPLAVNFADIFVTVGLYWKVP
jgi:hypothetical protein